MKAVNRVELKNLIVDIFDCLNRENIIYIILRNYDELPESVGHDIDILVSEDDITRFSIILVETARIDGWFLVQSANRSSFKSFFFVPIPFSLNKNGLKIDVWSPISWRGLTWIDSEIALNTRSYNANGFYIPSPGVEAASLLLKDLLQHGKINAKYFEKIQEQSIMDPETFRKVLQKPFGQSLSDQLLIAAQERKWNELEIATNSIRNSLVKKSIIDAPFRAFKNTLKFIFGHLNAFIYGNNNLFICFIGPDGSGKTTLSFKIRDALIDIFENISYYHGHYGFLPELKTFHPSASLNEKTKNSSHYSQKEPSSVIYCLLMFYYAIDYMMLYPRAFFKKNKSELIIFDRYFYDYLIQPTPFKISGSLFHLIAKVVPSPDILIYLKSPAQLIYKRKPELTISEISRQSVICDQIVAELPNTFSIDNSDSLENVTSEIINTILKFMIK